jgi:hypothetical protein
LTFLELQNAVIGLSNLITLNFEGTMTKYQIQLKPIAEDNEDGKNSSQDLLEQLKNF